MKTASYRLEPISNFINNSKRSHFDFSLFEIFRTTRGRATNNENNEKFNENFLKISVQTITIISC